MPDNVVLLSIPGLRTQDLFSMPTLAELASEGDQTSLVPSFPCVTCPVQANMTTGTTPREHGVVANGFYWRDKREVEMWTAWNEVIERPQIWDLLHQSDPAITSAVWFALHSKGCGADLVCTPAPIHNPDGSESLWCYTKPTPMYGTLRDALGHFPLQNFWGPLSSIKSTAWICDSAVWAAQQSRPNFFYIYLPHLDYAAQKLGPDSDAAARALGELDGVIASLLDGLEKAYAPAQPLFLVASEYTIVPVNHVVYPNRVLREAGLLKVKAEPAGPQGAQGQGGHTPPAGAASSPPGNTPSSPPANTAASPRPGNTPSSPPGIPAASSPPAATSSSPANTELIDFENSRAWALTDHQLSHVFVAEPSEAEDVAELFRGREGIDEVLVGPQRARYDLDHPRSGEVILISAANSWQAYYYWLSDDRAPTFARTVDIHRKPGYDPVEMHLDMATKSIPLDATLVRGSHGAPSRDPTQRGLLIASEKGVLTGREMGDTDVCELVLRQFGV